MWALPNWSHVDFGLGNGLMKWPSWGTVLCLIRCGHEILLRGRWKLYIYIQYQHWEAINQALCRANKNSLNIQSFNYLMYQLHHFYNYQRRIHQLVYKGRSWRRYFNLCHQKKEFTMTQNWEGTDRAQPALAYLVEVNKTKTLYTFKSHVAL